MRNILLLMFFLVSLSSPLIAADLERGKQLHRTCALCHGQQSQGVEGGKYPRLAGMRVDYMLKQLEDYKTGVRDNLTMTLVGQIKQMSEQDMEDLAKYIYTIDLSKGDHPFNIETAEGDIKNGKSLYKSDCKTCHGRNGKGVARKGAPRLAGQYTLYLKNQIAEFKARSRYHDNDEDDDTFDDYTDEEIQDILAYISTLDDGK